MVFNNPMSYSNASSNVFSACLQWVNITPSISKGSFECQIRVLLNVECGSDP